MILRYGAILSIVGLLLTTCDLKSEFDINPTDFFMQKKASADAILGFVPSRASDWHDFSMRGFLLGSEPYLAVKTNYAVESVPGIYIIDKDLKLVKKLTQSDLTFGALSWDPAMSFWNISGNASGTNVFMSFHTSYLSVVDNRIITVAATDWNTVLVSSQSSAGFMSSSLIGTNSIHVKYSSGTYAWINSPTVADPSPTGVFYGGGFLLSHATSKTGYIDTNGVTSVITGTGVTVATPYFRVLHHNNQLVLIQAIGGTASNAGLCDFFSSQVPSLTAAGVGSFFSAVTDSFAPLNVGFDKLYDGLPINSEVYIDQIAMISAGLIVPYPSGRDRLFDPESGKLLYIFDLNVQDKDHLNDSKDRYNHPRAYVSGADYWFMYDQDTREFKRLAGWWL